MGFYKVKTEGIAYWGTPDSKTINFDGKDYDIEYAKLNPKAFEKSHVEIVNENSVMLRIDNDPNNLI